MSAQRPVIPGFHPDPSICRVGDTYYLATSSFEYAPGVPIFRSTDLQAWEQIGNALDRPSQLDVSAAGPSGGIFAPTLRHHDGRFWLITTNWADDGGQLLVWAEDPAGPWSEPVRIPSAVGIDPDLAWDEDGTCLMTYAGFGPDGGEGIVQSAIDPLTGEVLTPRQWLWSGTGGKFPEGPHLYRVGDSWYLLIAEGGTERGHAVSIARGPTAQGPFEAFSGNPVLTHRGTDLPVQNTGHADLTLRPDGTWAIVYHGVRPRGSSPEWHVLGRETFADELLWVDGWPALAGHIDPVGQPGDVISDDLRGETLPPSWVAASRFPAEVMTKERDRWRVASTKEPVFVGRRQEHLFLQFRASLGVEGSGGISLRVDARHAVELEVSDEMVSAVWVIGDIRHVLGAALVSGTTDLVIATVPSEGHEFSTARGPDRVIAGIVTDVGFQMLGEIDGRYLSTEVAGGMTGRLAGIWCDQGSVVVESACYIGSDEPLNGRDLGAVGAKVVV